MLIDVVGDEVIESRGAEEKGGDSREGAGSDVAVVDDAAVDEAAVGEVATTGELDVMTFHVTSNRAVRPSGEIRSRLPATKRGSRIASAGR